MPIVTIDTNEWCTPTQLARNFGVTKQVINNWVKRGKVIRMRVPELEISLVRIDHDAFNKKKKRPQKVNNEQLDD